MKIDAERTIAGLRRWFPAVDGASRRRLLWFLLSSVAACATGFALVPPTLAEKLIVAGGYPYLLLVFVLFVALATRLAGTWRRVRKGVLGGDPRLLAVAAGCTLFAVASDEFGHKILFDEYVIQGTAWHLHAAKEVGAPVRAYDIAGTWTAIDTYLDKRPYFFAFLLSLWHDLSGYRVTNVFFLNTVLAAACIGLTGWVALALTRRRAAAALAMVLLATIPLFGQNATGAGLETLNLTMIVAVAAAGILCLRAPHEPDRQSLLVIAAVLLAQSRYESVLFVVPVAAIVLIAWRRAGRVVLPWPVIVAPLLLVPYAWHSRVVDANPQLWELRAGESARFGWRNVSGNLEGAWEFFRSVSPEQPGSLAVVLLGFAGAASLVGLILRGRRVVASPEASAVAWIGLGVAGHFCVLLFYYWARFDEPVTARFALPSLLMLSLLAAVAVRILSDRGWPVSRLAFGIWALWLVVIAGPVYAQRLYASRNLVLQEVEWELAEVRSRPGPVLVLTSKATLPHLLHRVPALHLSLARLRGAEIAWHLERGTFREVLVSQVIRPTTAEGDAAVDPADHLPESFRLEPIERKRFGARWVRLSRLVSVEPATSEARPSD